MNKQGFWVFLFVFAVVAYVVTAMADTWVVAKNQQQEDEEQRLQRTLEMENVGVIVDNRVADYLADEAGGKIKGFVGKLIAVNIAESYVVSNQIPKARGLRYNEPRWKHEIRFLLKLEFVVNKRHFVILYLTGTGVWEIGRDFLISVHPDGIVTIRLRTERENES